MSHVSCLCPGRCGGPGRGLCVYIYIWPCHLCRACVVAGVVGLIGAGVYDAKQSEARQLDEELIARSNPHLKYDTDHVSRGFVLDTVGCVLILIAAVVIAIHNTPLPAATPARAPHSPGTTGTTTGTTGTTTGTTGPVVGGAVYTYPMTHVTPYPATVSYVTTPPAIVPLVNPYPIFEAYVVTTI